MLLDIYLPIASEKANKSFLCEACHLDYQFFRVQGLYLPSSSARRRSFSFTGSPLACVCFCAFLALVAMSLEQLRKTLTDETVKNELFRLLESEVFSEAAVAELYPGLAKQWTDIAHAIQVPWQYIMVMDLALASAMAPTAVLFPLPTLQIYPVVWWFLLHPGATNTSAAVRLFSDVLDLLERDMNKKRDDLRAGWTEANAGQRQGQNPFGGAVSITGGSGSLEGEGKLMALPQNFGRSVSFMTEGKRLLKWLQSEGALNESIVVELWERLRLSFCVIFFLGPG